MASNVVRSILQALVYLHRNGIVHRDLKLENILCKSKNWPELGVKIADFGFAELMVSAEQRNGPDEGGEKNLSKSPPPDGKHLMRERGETLMFWEKPEQSRSENPGAKKEKWHGYD